MAVVHPDPNRPKSRSTTLSFPTNNSASPFFPGGLSRGTEMIRNLVGETQAVKASARGEDFKAVSGRESGGVGGTRAQG